MGFFSGLLDFIPGIVGGLRDDDRNARAAADQRQSSELGAERQMAFASAEASSARGWMERMAGTAHQREIADLRAAGLNPILSGTGGMGSATPGSPSPSGSAAGAGMQSPSSSGAMAAASAMAIRRNRAEVDNMEMDTKLKLEQKRAAHESIYRTKWESDFVENQARSELERWGLLKDQRVGSATEAQIDRSAYGRGLRYVDRIGQTINSAGSARRLFRQ